MEDCWVLVRAVLLAYLWSWATATNSASAKVGSRYLVLCRLALVPRCVGQDGQDAVVSASRSVTDEVKLSFGLLASPSEFWAGPRVNG